MNITQKIRLERLPAMQKPVYVWHRLLYLSDRFLTGYTVYKAAELQRIYDLPVADNSPERKL